MALSWRRSGTVRPISSLLVLLCLMACTREIQAQSDADLFAQGMAALKKYHDCKAARQAFEAESPSARNDWQWLENTAQAAECANDLKAALGYYEREQSLLPTMESNQAQATQPFLTRKIGDLRYQIAKKEQSQAAFAAQQAATRERLEKQSIAAQNAGTTLDSLVTLLNGISRSRKEKNGYIISDVFKASVLSPPSCRISISYNENSYYKGDRYTPVENRDSGYDATINLDGLEIQAPKQNKPDKADGWGVYISGKVSFSLNDSSGLKWNNGDLKGLTSQEAQSVYDLLRTGISLCTLQ